MAIVISEGKLTKEQFERAKEDYGVYVKITADLETGAMVVGGEYHADAERMLLASGSRQENIWGGGINLETGQFETNAMVNLRAGKNDSTEILDPVKRERFLEIARRALEGSYE